jgi:hypothetical protein
MSNSGYDTNGELQTDGSYIGNWWVGRDVPNTKYKDLIVEIKPQDISRSYQANGWNYAAYAYIDYLYADLDGGPWSESEKSYEIHISAAGDAWENVDIERRRCGLPIPDRILRATAEAEDAHEAIAAGIEVEPAHRFYPTSELDWVVIDNRDYQLRISFIVTNTLDVEKRFWVDAWLDACTCAGLDQGQFFRSLEGGLEEVTLAPHESQTITLQTPIFSKQKFVSLDVVNFRIQDDDYNVSREWTFTRYSQ